MLSYEDLDAISRMLVRDDFGWDGLENSLSAAWPPGSRGTETLHDPSAEPPDKKTLRARLLDFSAAWIAVRCGALSPALAASLLRETASSPDQNRRLAQAIARKRLLDSDEIPRLMKEAVSRTFECAECSLLYSVPPDQSWPDPACFRCAAPLGAGVGPVDAPARPRRPTRIGRFKVESELGRGGMGVVYKAVDSRTGEAVAIKLLTEQRDESLEANARFRREIEAVSALSHPNIVHVVEAGEDSGRPYLAMEFLPGPTLDDVIASGSAGRPLMLRAIASAARALHHAHGCNLLHRDVKPGNILFNASGDAKIADFGLARSIDPGQTKLTATGTVVGTPYYMAPEQVAGRRDLDARVDVYALGAIIYEIATGGPPFTGESALEIVMKISDQDPVPPSRVAPEIHRDLEFISLKALSKDRRDRYPTALDLALDLERHLRGEQLQGKPPAAHRRLLSKLKRRPVVAALTGAGLAFAALAAGLAVWVATGAQGRRLQDPRDQGIAAAPSPEYPGRGRESPDRQTDSSKPPAPPDAPRADALSEYEAGVSLASIRRFEDAEERFTRALEADPACSAAFRGRAAARLALGRDAEALDDLGRAIAAQPGFSAARFERASLLESMGSSDEAAEDLRAVVRADPGNVQALLRLGSILERSGDVEAAIDAFASAVEADPDDPAALRGRGSTLVRAGKAEDGVGFLRAAALASPSDAMLRLELGRALLMIGEKEDAGRHLAAGASIAPMDAGVHVEFGRELTAAGMSEEAVAAFERAEAIDPGCSTAVLEKGMLLFSLGRFAAAADAMDPAASAGNASVKEMTLAGRANAAAGRVNKALELFTRALSLSPGDPDARLGRAECLKSAGMFAEAAADADALVDANPGCVAARLLRAELLSAGADPSPALPDLEAVLVAEPMNERALEIRAAVRAAAGDVDGAIADAATLCRADPDDARRALAHGNLLMRAGRPAQAADEIERAIALGAGVDAAAIAAKCRMKAGEPAAAEAILRRAIASDPDDGANWFALSCSLGALGRKEEAIDALEKAEELGAADIRRIEADPDLLRLRGEPRFEALAARLKRPR